MLYNQCLMSSLLLLAVSFKNKKYVAKSIVLLPKVLRRLEKLRTRKQVGILMGFLIHKHQSPNIFYAHIW